MALDRAPSKVTQSVCLQSPTSPCPLVPSFLTGAVSYSVPQDAQRKFRRSNLSQPRRYRPFSSHISPDQGARLLPEPNCAGKLTGKPLTRKSSAAQPGRSQPRRRKAFLRLAWTHCIEALPRQSLHSYSPTSIVVRVVMVRRRSTGCVSPAHARISANAT
jgi:hypothetical protein